MFGNRGGCFHIPGTPQVRGRSFASRQWICCVLSFKGRQRSVWGKGYTELFFTDEVTAFAAGHRPCFECRRERATAFASAWGRAKGTAAPKAPEIDVVLHAERLEGGRAYRKRLHTMDARSLPSGTMVVLGGAPHAIDGALLRPWTFAGFQRPTAEVPVGEIKVLTPPSITAAFAEGYRPSWQMASTADARAC